MYYRKYEIAFTAIKFAFDIRGLLLDNVMYTHILCVYAVLVPACYYYDHYF